MCWHQGVAIKSVTIVPDGDKAGYVRPGNVFGDIDPAMDYTGSRGRMRMEKLVRILCAGKIAQRKFNPKGYRRYQDKSDRERAIDILMSYTGSTEEVEAYYRLLVVQTHNALSDPDLWRAVKVLAGVLVESPTLSGKRASKVIVESQQGGKRSDAHRGQLPVSSMVNAKGSRSTSIRQADLVV